MQSNVKNAWIVVVLVAALAAAGSAQASPILIGNWGLDDASGNAAESVAGRNGTLVGSIANYQVAGAIGHAMRFGGTGYFTVADGTSASNAIFSGNGLTTGSVSLCYWLTCGSIPFGTDRLAVANYHDTISQAYHTGVQNYGNSFEVQVWPSSGAPQIKKQQASTTPNPPFPVSANTWLQLTATWNKTSGSLLLYLNGVQVGSATGNASAIKWGGGLLSLGATYNGNQKWADGLDDIGIWDGTLSSVEAAAIYNTPKLFGLGVDNQYGLGVMDQLFQLYANKTGSVAVGDLGWTYTTGLSGHNAGEAWTDGGKYYLQLGGGDGLVGSVVPEPGTLALLAAGLVGLLAYAWRKRK